MISPSSLFSPMDPESQRKRALASVYDFLLKLADEKKDSTKFIISGQKPENESAPLQNNIPPDV